jgi:transposase
MVILEEQVLSLDQEIQERMKPVYGQVNLVDSIPGVGERSAQIIIAEIGINMNQFSSASHLASWAGLCPGNNEVQVNVKEVKPVKETIYLGLH